MSDKYTTTDGQWYTPEALKYERERAEKALEEMKHLEKKFKRTRKAVKEKTLCGTITHYIKKK